MTAKEISEIINQNQGKEYFSIYAIRTDNKEYAVGDIMDVSFDWIEGESTGELLDGVCGTSCGSLWYDGENEDVENIQKALDIQKSYTGKHQYIICGTESEYGNDENEVIIPDAKVIGIIK